MSSLLNQLMQKCTNDIVDNDVIYSIQDLELLIERHTQNRYGSVEYNDLFEHTVFSQTVLSQNEANEIVYFLFYLLFNYPDRASYTAMGIKKCYGYDILRACCNAIRIYLNQNDAVVINLLDGIMNNNSKEDLAKYAQATFDIVLKDGLLECKEYLNKRLKTYGNL